MNQVLAIQNVQKKIREAITNENISIEDMHELLKDIDHDLQAFLDTGVDFKIAIDALDDSIFITDKNGKVMYVNPAHYKNTSILPEEIMGRYTEDIINEGTLFTGGATMDVIRTKKKAFRLSTVTKTNPPGVGYAVGVPIFDDNGQLYQVVVSSRPILTLQALHEDFGRFLKEANALNESKEHIVTIVPGKGDKGISSKKLIGSSYALKKVWSTIEKAAPTDATVLITGESGVGKEIVADEIYRLSKRNKETFIKVNCASIPANLLESELFGYEKGAFSGANTTGKQGLFEMANGGTLLLDEIGDMPMDLQVKLLRAIQDKEITRVGGTKPIELDIRFIASTNSDLKAKIRDGLFRQDLFYRLNVIPIYIPPLRERINDLDELCSHFVRIFTEKHKRKLTISDENMSIMRSYRWPGNVRELENVIEYLTICSSGTDNVDSEMLLSILDISQGDSNIIGVGTLTQSLESYEKGLIETALKTSTSLRDAGAKLGVNASTISRKIKQYGIDYPNSNKK